MAPVGRACYSGPFRFEPVSIVARRDLRRPDAGSLVVTLEAAWEPRLQIISLMQRMADVRAVDERGEPLPVADPAAQPEVPISGEATAVKLDLPLQLPPRDVRQIASLKGKLLATIPGRIETFRFSKLADAKNVQQRIAGVTVTLEQVRKTAPMRGAGGVRNDKGVGSPHHGAVRRCRRRPGLASPMDFQQSRVSGRPRREADGLRQVRDHGPGQERSWGWLTYSAPTGRWTT